MQLTGVRADGEGEDPEEEGECQSGTKHDHISHHLQVFLHQHVTLRAHGDRRTVLQDRRHVRQTHQCMCVFILISQERDYETTHEQKEVEEDVKINPPVRSELHQIELFDITHIKTAGVVNHANCPK